VSARPGDVVTTVAKTIPVRLKLTQSSTSKPSPHPALTGREQEAGELADAVRRLIGLTMDAPAPPEVTKEAVRALEAVADMLQRHVPDPPLPKTLLHEPDPGDGDLGARMPFDNVIGRYNPLALPLELEFDREADPPRALLRGAFTRAYEGPPGCVHGAVLAASFDIAFAAANFIAGMPGPTVRLEIDYRRPTALHAPCVFEAWVESHDDRRVRTVGRLVQRDKVTVEAVGDFAKLDQSQIARMVERTR